MTFTLNGIEFEVNDVMVGIPRRYRAEFAGKNFTDKELFERALMYARCADEAIRYNSWKYDIDEINMRACLAECK